jgi:DNA primase
MKKIKTAIAMFVEREGDPASIIQSFFPEWQPGQENVNCPWHEDTRASLHIHPSGKAFCHGCRVAAKDLIELISKVEGKSYEDTARLIHDLIVDPIPASWVEDYIKALWKDEEALDYLRITRNIMDSTIKRHRLGLSPKDRRIMIPVFDEFGACVNVRRMGWRTEHERKALNRKEHGTVRLYPEGEAILSRRLLLCEGEFDCLVARQWGLPAVTWTAGATSWNERYNYLFQDKAVWILYDNDDGGRAGAAQAVEKLKGVAQHVEVVNIFNDLKGKDITDWSFEHGVPLSELKTLIERYKFPKNAVARKICPYCHQTIKEKT